MGNKINAARIRKVEGVITILPLTAGKHLYCFKSSASVNIFLGLERIKSYFWKQMFISWLDYKVYLGLIKRKIRNLLICLKTNAYGIIELWCTEVNCYFILDWVNAALLYVSDLASQHILFNEIVRKVGHSPSKWFEYNPRRSAVRARATPVGLGAAPTPTTSDLGEGLLPRTTRLRLVAANASEPCSVSFWKRKLDMKLEKQQWTLAKKCTKESRVQLLHWKILHNISQTGVLLHKMGIRSFKKMPVL